MAALHENPRFCNNEVVGTKKKLENFWFYYKWWVLAGVLVAVLLGLLVNDLVSKQKYDSSVVIVAHGSITDEQEDAIDTLLDGFATDRDGNGRANVSLLSIQGFMQETSTYSYASDVQFTVYLQSDENNVWIIDDYTKKYLEDSGVYGDAFTGEAVSLDKLFSATPGLGDMTGFWLVQRNRTTHGDEAVYEADMALLSAAGAAAK